MYLDDTIKLRVRFVSEKANQMGILDSHTPTAIVAGSIYYVVIENGLGQISKKTIEYHCKVSVPTISKVCDKLCRVCTFLL